MKNELYGQAALAAIAPTNMGRFSTLHTHSESAYGGLECHFQNNPKPQFALSTQGVIIAENKTAKVFLADGFLRRGLGGKLTFRSKAMDNKVRNVLFEMGQERYGCKRVIGRVDSDEWVTFDFALIKMGAEKEIMMTVNEESFYRNCTHDAFDEAFHLTITEAHVISQIALGLSPKEIAIELSISTNTVRAHLRSIYSKTEVRSFSKLLCLILRLTR